MATKRQGCLGTEGAHRVGPGLVRIILPSFLLVFLPLFMGGLSGQNPEAPDAEDRAEIERAVRDGYIKGLETREFSLIRNLCLPGTIMQSGGRDGRLRTTTLDDWSARFDPGTPPFDSLESTITKVDQAGTAAQVRIDFVMNGSRHIVDYLHLLWVDGSWRVAHIIDYSFGPVPPTP